MFSEYSFVNTLSEYGFDCLDRSDALLREVVCDNVIEVTTQYGSILLTPETLVCTGRGLWKRVDELYIGDSLKHYTMNKAIITGITLMKEPQMMLKLVDCACGYLVIDGVYVSAD